MSLARQCRIEGMTPNDGLPTLTAIAPIEWPLYAARYLDIAITANKNRDLNRADVEAAYEHPAPEVPMRTWRPGDPTPSTLRAVEELGEANGWRSDLHYARGTMPPRWTVNLPTNKDNPGPPVDPSQYVGELADIVGLRLKRKHSTMLILWANGRFETAVLQERGPRVELNLGDAKAKITA